MQSPTMQQAFKNSLMAVVFIWLGIVLYTLLEGISGALTLHEYQPNIWLSLRWITIYHWLPWLLLTPVVLVIADKLPVLPGNWRKLIPLHTLLLLAITLLHGLMTSFVYVWIGFITPDMQGYEPWQHAGHFLFGESMFVIDCVIYTCLIGVFNIRRFFQVIRENELDTLKVSEQLSEAKLNALRTQVNPHFLFNTLNSISVLVGKNENKKARTMIEKLSMFFRQTLDSSSEHWVTLQKEIEMIQNYLDIEKIRIGDRLKIYFDVDEQALDFSVPMLITQPLVENAIRHGVAKKTGECELRIEAKMKNRYLYLRISDNGAGHDFHALAKCQKGIGIENVRQRMKQTYGSDLGFRLDGIRGKGVIATLELPIMDNFRESAAL